MIQTRIEKMVYGGEGLARVEGRVALAPMVLPGELVEIEPLNQRDPRLLRGRLHQVIEASPSRVEPPCPYFGRCGGCHYQHAPYEGQLRFKSEILVETLKRIGKLDAPEPEIVSGEAWEYRNRAQFKVLKQGKTFHLGYLQAGSNLLVDIDRCPISSPAINDAIPHLIQLGRRPDFPIGSSEVEIVDNGSKLLITLRSEGRFPETLVGALREHLPSLTALARADNEGGFFRLYGDGFLRIPAGDFSYRISHGVFFQVNRFLVNTLAEVALDGLAGSTAFDLYAGAGYFTLPLAKRFDKVEAVESNPAAVRDLRANCTQAGLENVAAMRASTTEFMSRWEGPAPDAIVLDPPRAGLGQGGAKQLAGLHSPKIVYVACDPPTLARDLAVLVHSGYGIEKLYLVDLFPQTFHIEAVVILRLL